MAYGRFSHEQRRILYQHRKTPASKDIVVYMFNTAGIFVNWFLNVHNILIEMTRLGLSKRLHNSDVMLTT